MKYYLIEYKPPRDTFKDDATPEESAIIGEHFEYLKKLEADGRLLLAGRTDDAHIGIALVKADNQEEADDILKNDPAVSNNIFSGRISLFSMALHSGKNKLEN